MLVVASRRRRMSRLVAGRVKLNAFLTPRRTRPACYISLEAQKPRNHGNARRARCAPFFADFFRAADAHISRQRLAKFFNYLGRRRCWDARFYTQKETTTQKQFKSTAFRGRTPT